MIDTETIAQMTAWRRDLHQHPELSFDEHRTASAVESALAEMGLTPRRIAETGVVVDLPGRADGPLVALRADTDALPIEEATGLPFASQNRGVMHACGHDGHTSMLLGAARALANNPLPGPVRLFWQPAEEKGAGARTMIAAGVMEGVDAVFGGHIDPRYPVGTLIVTEGAVNASTDTFRIEVIGKGGHGARPHETVDAIVIGSLLVAALQTVVSREVNPASPAVISVGSFHAGSASNVIAGRAVLEGTIRSQAPAVRKHLTESVPRIARGVAALHGAEVKVEVKPGTPAVINAPGPTALARKAALEVAEHVVPLASANMGGEDFAEYLAHAPGAYIRYGALVAGREGISAHNSEWDFHEDALAYGARYLVTVARLASESQCSF